MVFGDLKLETTSERGSSTALMNRWRMAGLLWWRPGMATGPTLVSEKLDQAAEIPRERNVDVSPTFVRETLLTIGPCLDLIEGTDCTWQGASPSHGRESGSRDRRRSLLANPARRRRSYVSGRNATSATVSGAAGERRPLDLGRCRHGREP